jgi:tetratricopeptide (TPR) repeat protein
MLSRKIANALQITFFHPITFCTMHPTCKPFFLLLLCLLGTLALPAQQVFKQTLTYTPPEKGYEVRIPFAWKFIDCFGEVHLSITQKYDEITSDAYIYNGKRYTHLELGNDAFAKIGKGKTDISADVMHGQYKLGRVELKTVLDWAGGCFGQTYNVIAKLGLKNTDYVKKLQDLSLANVRIDYAGIRNMELEKKIAALEKQRSLEDKLREADEAFGREDNARAKQLYQEVLKMDPNNALAKQRLRELKTREENEKQEQAYQEQIAQGEDLLKKGDYQGAQSAFEKALNEKPDDAYAKRKIAEIERHLKDIRKSKQAKKAVVSAAQSRRHQGFFWGRDLGGGTSVGAAQSARLIGNFRLDYDIWVMAGEPVHRWRFYWEWENYSGQYGKTGYPLWISILRDTVIQIADLKKYPDLMARWDQLKPLYVEIKSDILSFKMGDEHVASAGTIRIVPEGIGRSGQELDWSLPASSNWDELFPYCNELHWDYFQALGPVRGSR